MKQILRNNIVYIGLCLVFLIALGIALLVCPKGELHIWMNAYHSPFLDSFFKYFTAIGEWVPYVIVVALLFYSYGWSAFLLTNIAIGGLIGQGLKYAFDTDRPLTWFANNMPDVQLQLVDGIHMSKFYSFPSGHTFTFFALFFTLSLILTDYLAGASAKNNSSNWKNDKILSVTAQIIFFLFALTGAYSRIYLSQHFAEDIWGGAFFGIAFSLLLCAFLPRFSGKKWFKMHFFEKKSQKNLVD